MRRLLLLVTIPAMAAAQTPLPELPEIDVKSLPRIPGPMTDHLGDPSRGIGTSAFDTQIRAQARHAGTVEPAVALPPGSLKLQDAVSYPAGWKAYRVDVPAHGAIHARLRGNHEAWFRVRTVNRWGSLEKGMLQNKIPTGNPEASYKNPTGDAKSIYFIVDTTEADLHEEPFTLEIRVS